MHNVSSGARDYLLTACKLLSTVTVVDRRTDAAQQSNIRQVMSFVVCSRCASMLTQPQAAAAVAAAAIAAAAAALHAAPVSI